ncbi:DUF6162 family protein [Candidatus Electronema sp. PJ]|uniref:DUF6162 family protein n=1 Tax=Candidatus Electronema sp. PJ TaxID=3401572 RepID=UPI003AA95B48
MPVVKEIVVVPKAAGREALGLLAAICCILFLVGLRVVQVRPENAEEGSKVYQMQDIKLKNQAPVLYRSLLGAADTITQLREENGNWPDIAALQQEDLPPFAAKFLPAGLNGFGWEFHQGATWADYYGTNRNVLAAEKAGADPLENSFILRIIDLQAGKYPHPVAQQAKGQENRFSVQIWLNPKTADYPEGQPADKGWKWVVSGHTPVSEEQIN